MRLNNYIKEAKEKDWLEDAVRKIQKNCKPWLKESKLLPGHRSSRKNITDHIRKASVRTDRRPLTMPRELHSITDNLFRRQYGWFARSNVLFVQGSDAPHMFYGNFTYAVYPIGSYKYLWSPDIRDLTPQVDTLTMRLENEQGIESGDPKYLTTMARAIEMLIEGSYKSTDLYTALTKYKMHEIMINCKKYYIVPKVWDIFIGRELFKNG